MFKFTSTLPTKYAEALEELLFFNPNQQAMQGAIVSSVEQFGQPSIITDGENLRIKLEKLNAVQTVFAMDGDVLTGVLVYSRTNQETLTVIHIAVNPEYSSNGEYSANMLFLRMLALLRSTARRIKDVKVIQIINDENQVLNCPI